MDYCSGLTIAVGKTGTFCILAIVLIRLHRNRGKLYASSVNVLVLHKSGTFTQIKKLTTTYLFSSIKNRMTVINIATDIPSAINTLEQLAVWTGLALANINPSLTAIEGVGYTERVSQAGIFYVQADNKYRALIRNSIQMSPDYLAGGSKMWTFAQALSNTAIPPIFKAN